MPQPSLNSVRQPSDKPPTTRSFVAIHLTQGAETAVRQARDSLRERLRGLPIKWVGDQNLHLTLRFLGHVQEEPLAQVRNNLENCKLNAFELRTAKLGAFPSDRAARVIWIGLSGELQKLISLQDCVEHAVGDLAPHEENKPFNPHLTIARCELRAPDREYVRRALSEVAVDEVAWAVQSFELMKSSLSPKGATHTQLAQYQLS